MKKTLLFLIVMSIMGCTSIIDNRPSDANAFLSKAINSASKGLLYFSQFEKLDGIEQQDKTLLYTLSYKGFVAANKECYWDGQIMGIGLHYSYYGDDFEGRAISPIRVGETIKEAKSKSTIEGSRGLSFVKTGYGYNVEGKVVFEKRDSGWKIIAVSCLEESDAKKLRE